VLGGGCRLAETDDDDVSEDGAIMATTSGAKPYSGEVMATVLGSSLLCLQLRSDGMRSTVKQACS
jgi:hypothetical protein